MTTKYTLDEALDIIFDAEGWMAFIFEHCRDEFQELTGFEVAEYWLDCHSREEIHTFLELIKRPEVIKFLKEFPL